MYNNNNKVLKITYGHNGGIQDDTFSKITYCIHKHCIFFCGIGTLYRLEPLILNKNALV
jgi:hypothetical protein